MNKTEGQITFFTSFFKRCHDVYHRGHYSNAFKWKSTSVFSYTKINVFHSCFGLWRGSLESRGERFHLFWTGSLESREGVRGLFSQLIDRSKLHGCIVYRSLLRSASEAGLLQPWLRSRRYFGMFLETKTQMAMRRFASSNFSTNYIASESFFNQ